MTAPAGSRKLFGMAAGPAAFTLTLLLPAGVFGFAARAAIATVVWMAVWWIIRPVDIAVTAMLPVVINAVFGLVPMDGIIAQYASEIVILLLGADLVSLTWGETGLDRRLSLGALCLIGPSVKQQIAAWFLISAGLSIFLPNAVVCAILTPVAISMLNFIGEDDLSRSKVSVVILLSVAWGAGLGGVGSPLGGAMNLVAISYIEGFTGAEFMYIGWVVRLMPFLLVLLLVDILYLWRVDVGVDNLGGTRDYFVSQYRALPKMGRGETLSLLLFAAATLLAFVRPLYADLLPGLKPAYVFLLFGVLGFALPGDGGDSLITWKRAEKQIIWGMLLLFAGGLAAGKLITDTGAAASLAAVIAQLSLGGGILTIGIFVVFTCVLAEVSSNTAAAAIAIPVVFSITQQLGLNPLPYIYITAAAFNSAYVLPISVRAVPVGYGMDPKALMRNGLVLSPASMAIITLMGWAFLTFWPYFST